MVDKRIVKYKRQDGFLCVQIYYDKTIEIYIRKTIIDETVYFVNKSKTTQPRERHKKFLSYKDDGTMLTVKIKYNKNVHIDIYRSNNGMGKILKTLDIIPTWTEQKESVE